MLFLSIDKTHALFDIPFFEMLIVFRDRSDVFFVRSFVNLC